VAVAVLGLHHAGLYVASLERSIAFYREIFGLEVAERFDFGDEQLALLRVGNRRLELMQSPGVSSRASGVVDHVALQVDDLDAAIELIEVSPSAE
jgi:lactoylglutathione lyase